MIKSLKKRLKKICNYFEIKKYKGEVVLGKKVKFNQKIQLYGNGKIEIGNNTFLGFEIGGGFKEGQIEIQTRTKEAKIIIGNNVGINNNIFLCSRKSIEIKDNCLIGRNVSIMDHNGHGINPNERTSNPGTSRKIIINENVWIGNYATILSGTIIGKNAIIGVGAVVKGDIPENSIVEGNPGKVTKQII